MRARLRRLWRRATRRPLPPILAPPLEALDPGIVTALDGFTG